MRLRVKSFAVPAVLLALLASPLAGRATSCTMQAELQPLDRDALAEDGWPWPWPGRMKPR